MQLGSADGTPPHICIWDASTPDTAELARLTLHTKGVEALAWSADGTQVDLGLGGLLLTGYSEYSRSTLSTHGVL